MAEKDLPAGTGDPFELVFSLLMAAVHPREFPRLRRRKGALRQELNEIWALGRSLLGQEISEEDKLFLQLADQTDKASQKRATNGKFSPQNKVATTLVLALAELYVEAVRPAYGIRTLSGSDDAKFSQFLITTVRPLDSDYLTANISMVWRRARKKMFPLNRLL